MSNFIPARVHSQFNRTYIFSIVVFFAFLAACYNPIMSQWWETVPNNYVQESASGGSGVNFGVVRFNTQGGEPQPLMLIIAWGNPVGRLRPVVLAGAGFAGWVDENGRPWDVETRRIKPEDDVNGDGFIDLKAMWSTLRFTVTFNANVPDLVSVSNPPEPQIIASGGNAVQPTQMVVTAGDGSSCGGWFTMDGTTTGNWGREWDFSKDIISTNITLHARWGYTVRTVRFEPNGGMRANNTELTRVQFTIYVNPLSHPPVYGRIIDPGPLVRDGHAFDGWYTTPNFLPNSAWNFSTDTLKEVDIAPGRGDYFYLYAKWIPNIYTVRFDANGGAPAPANREVIHGERIVEPPVMSRPDLAFVGWYTVLTDPLNPANLWNFNTGTVKSNITLNAAWGPRSYTVRFHLGHPNGAAPNPVFTAPAVQHTSGTTGTAFEPFMRPLPATDTSSWAFYRWHYHPDVNANPADVNVPAFRAALLPWGFDRAVSEAVNDDDVLNLYARWVPSVPDMVWVPRGSFTMGDSSVSGTPAIHHAYPTRSVTLDGFYIGRTQVTQAQYRVMLQQGDNNAELSQLGSHVSPSNTRIDADNNPVERVSWFDAIYFSYLLTADRTVSENLTQVYTINDSSTAGIPGATYLLSINSAAVTVDWDASGYRLPTEAEWEFAARGGHGSPGNFMYSGSDNADAVAWFNTNSSGRTHSVRGKQPNALGIFDMSGNVSEWTWDEVMSYTNIRALSGNDNNPAIGGPPPISGAQPRVRRGGAWSNAVGNVRVVVRNSDTPDTAHWAIGFRL
ncbi:MAG: SUMF1/EgtB/PvdO family nonheme iron enzyme, partial [Treponema sp.]|nr:SUMF1/EgtB/PvdO family nonheme iron enzyme [Treponema sp.]